MQKRRQAYKLHVTSKTYICSTRAKSSKQGLWACCCFFCKFKVGRPVQHLRKQKFFEKKRSSSVCMRGSRALTGLKGTAVVCQDSNGSQRPSCQSELLLCSLWCFSAALTLWLVYLSTMMAEGWMCGQVHHGLVSPLIESWANTCGWSQELLYLAWTLGVN